MHRNFWPQKAAVQRGYMLAPAMCHSAQNTAVRTLHLRSISRRKRSRLRVVIIVILLTWAGQEWKHLQSGGRYGTRISVSEIAPVHWTGMRSCSSDERILDLER